MHGVVLKCSLQCMLGVTNNLHFAVYFESIAIYHSCIFVPAGLEEDDPSIYINWAPGASILASMKLPECPPGLRQPPGATGPAAENTAKEALCTWLDATMTRCTHGRDIILRDPNDQRMMGQYTGLRSGEWGAVQGAMSTHPMERWISAIIQAHLTCGSITVMEGSHGTGHNNSHVMSGGPFRVS